MFFSKILETVKKINQLTFDIPSTVWKDHESEN